MSDEARVADTRPVVLKLEPGTYYWCSCGRSENQPWCDGSHKGTPFRPEAVTIDAEKNYAMCACKRSGKGAFCDGTHSKL
jgi:CDGSH-type Zn-finger protein